MTAGSGHYDAQGNACLTFHLCGVRHEPPGVELTGIIDTGFTGFLSSHILIGMDFLRRFSRALIVSRTAVLLIDEGRVSE